MRRRWIRRFASVAVAAFVGLAIIGLVHRAWNNAANPRKNVAVAMLLSGQPVRGHVEIVDESGEHVAARSVGRSGKTKVGLDFGHYRASGLSRDGLFCGPALFGVENSPGQGPVFLQCHPLVRSATAGSTPRT